MLAHNNRIGGSYQLLIQSRRHDAVPVDLHAFLAQALGMCLTLGEQVTVFLVLTLTSAGMAGVPGSSFLALSATVAAISHGSIPVAVVAHLLGADRIMDSMRVSMNLLGSCVATFVVAHWEAELAKGRMRRVLHGQNVPPREEGDPLT